MVDSYSTKLEKLLTSDPRLQQIQANYNLSFDRLLHIMRRSYDNSTQKRLNIDPSDWEYIIKIQFEHNLRYERRNIISKNQAAQQELVSHKIFNNPKVQKFRDFVLGSIILIILFYVSGRYADSSEARLEGSHMRGSHK